MGMPAPDASGELGRRLMQACTAAKGGEHGHELNSPEPAVRAYVHAPASPRPSLAPGGGAWTARARRVRGDEAAGHGAVSPATIHRRGGEGCAQNMSRAERKARVVSLDERDHALLLRAESRQVVDFEHRHPRSSRDLSEQFLGVLTSFEGVHLGHRTDAEVAAV